MELNINIKITGIVVQFCNQAYHIFTTEARQYKLYTYAAPHILVKHVAVYQ